MTSRDAEGAIGCLLAGGSVLLIVTTDGAAWLAFIMLALGLAVIAYAARA